MTNSIIVEFLSSDGSVSSVKQFASIKDFIKEYPDFKYHHFKYHQVRKIYLHFKNKNVDQTKFFFTHYPSREEFRLMGNSK